MGRSSTDILLLWSIWKDVIGAESGISAISLITRCPRSEPNTWPIMMLLRDYPIGPFFGIDLRRRLLTPIGKRKKSRYYSSISTGLKTSTTHWGTRSVIASCKKLHHD